MAGAHRVITKIVCQMGTKTTVQTLATNLPALLQTATANLILLQQHSKTMRNSPAMPHVM